MLLLALLFFADVAADSGSIIVEVVLRVRLEEWSRVGEMGENGDRHDNDDSLDK